MAKVNKRLIRDIGKISYETGSLYLKDLRKGIYEITGTVKYGAPRLEPDIFEVLIKVPEAYPFSVPILLEIGGRYSFRGTRHINDDGTCCVEVPAVLERVARNGLSLDRYLNSFVIPFFANQIHFDQEGYFLSERSHGDDGIREHIMSVLDTSDYQEVVQLIQHASTNHKVRRNDKCICGSDVKYKFCHLRKFTELNRYYSEQELRVLYAI